MKVSSLASVLLLSVSGEAMSDVLKCVALSRYWQDGTAVLLVLTTRWNPLLGLQL